MWTHRPPFLAADCIVLKHNKVLLIKRKNPPYGWALPGGFVDYGESTESACIRELREETNLVALDTPKLLTVMSEPNRDPRFHVVSCVYVVSNFTGEAKAKDDALEIRWFTLDDLPTLAFDHIDILNEFLKNSNTIQP